MGVCLVANKRTTSNMPVYFTSRDVAFTSRDVVSTYTNLIKLSAPNRRYLWSEWSEAVNLEMENCCNPSNNITTDHNTTHTRQKRTIRAHQAPAGPQMMSGGHENTPTDRSSPLLPLVTDCFAFAGRFCVGAPSTLRLRPPASAVKIIISISPST